MVFHLMNNDNILHDHLKMLKLQLRTARNMPWHGVQQYHSHIKLPTQPSSDNYRQLLVLRSVSSSPYCLC